MGPKASFRPARQTPCAARSPSMKSSGDRLVSTLRGIQDSEAHDTPARLPDDDAVFEKLAVRCSLRLAETKVQDVGLLVVVDAVPMRWNLQESRQVLEDLPDVAGEHGDRVLRCSLLRVLHGVSRLVASFVGP